MKFAFVLSTTLLILLINVAVGGKALKFLNYASDYILHQPDMEPLQDAFSVCSWVRSLKVKTNETPCWLAYAVSGSLQEITIPDDGCCNYIFDKSISLYSHFSGLKGSGIWYHYCMTWSYSSLKQRVYLNGLEIGNSSTPAGRRLTTGGYLVLGNEHDYYPLQGFEEHTAFGGELYKTNFFSKELSSSEVLEMSQYKCSLVERSYGDLRVIKWENILSWSRSGDVTDIDSGCNIVPSKFLVSILHVAVKH